MMSEARTARHRVYQNIIPGDIGVISPCSYYMQLYKYLAQFVCFIVDAHEITAANFSHILLITSRTPSFLVYGKIVVVNVGYLSLYKVIVFFYYICIPFTSAGSKNIFHDISFFPSN